MCTDHRATEVLDNQDTLGKREGGTTVRRRIEDEVTGSMWTLGMFQWKRIIRIVRGGMNMWLNW